MKFITPDWSAPHGIHALTTTRDGGISQAPFDSLNLGDHVGDSPDDVAANRALLVQLAGLPQPPCYLNQTHSTRVIDLPYVGEDLNADAVYTNQPNQVCLVMTADCLPVLFCSKDGQEVAAAHAGWRGLCSGILENTVSRFACPVGDIQVWLGPAIGAAAFQVGEEVCEQFCAFDPNAAQAFAQDPTASGKFLADIYHIASQRLNLLGIRHISGGNHCTYRDKEHFFSYRRDGQTGRMASLIWRAKSE